MSQHDEEYVKDIIRRLVPPRSNEERISDLEKIVENLASKKELSDVRVEFHKTNLDMVKWIAGTFIFSASLVLGVLRFLSQ